MSLEVSTKWYTRTTTPVASVKSVLNTINPLSAFIPGLDYVPKALVRAFRGDDEWNLKDKNALKAAHLVSKIAAGALTFGLGAMSLRALMHFAHKDAFKVSKNNLRFKLFYIKPTLSMISMQDSDSSLSNLAEELITKKSSAFLAPLPLLASIFAASVGFKAADSFFDRKRILKLTELQLLLLKAKSDLALRRILIARGLNGLDLKKSIIENNLDSLLHLNKKATTGVLKSALGLCGFLSLLLGIKGGMLLHDSIDLDTIKFKAYLKSLKQYNKTRALLEDIVSKNIDPLLLSYLNSNLETNKSIRDAAALQDAGTLKELTI